ncbi:MAG: hypothetical protein K6A74_01040, partial [Lachnospiraceae bacterium]|nr:hypothetical protein [Lachnospiraceae bacterium]
MKTRKFGKRVTAFFLSALMVLGMVISDVNSIPVFAVSANSLEEIQSGFSASDNTAEETNTDTEETIQDEQEPSVEEPAPIVEEPEERLVTVTYKATKGGRVSSYKETIDLNDPEASFTGATASAWNDKYTFVDWKDADGVQVSAEATFVPADITEDATFTAEFVAVEDIAELMPKLEATDVHVGGMIVSVTAEEGIFPAETNIVINAISDEQALETALT